MGWTPTLIGLAFGVALFAWANWQARQPVEFGRVRMIPYNGLMFAALVIVLLMVAHAMTLLGLKPDLP